MKKERRENTMSFAATKTLKKRIIAQAKKENLRISRFITMILEQRLDLIDKNGGTVETATKQDDVPE